MPVTIESLYLLADRIVRRTALLSIIRVMPPFTASILKIAPQLLRFRTSAKRRVPLYIDQQTLIRLHLSYISRMMPQDIMDRDAVGGMSSDGWDP